MASNSKKRRRVLGASCILAALIIASSSFAWFTSKDEVTNRLSASGDYDVTIAEDFTPPNKWLPGQKVDKNVGVVNTGNIDAFTRVWLEGEMKVLAEARDKAKWDTSNKKFVDGGTEVLTKDYTVGANDAIGSLVKETDETFKNLNLNYYYGNAGNNTKVSLKELTTTTYQNPNLDSTATVTTPDAYSEVMSVQAGGNLVYVEPSASGTTFYVTPNEALSFKSDKGKTYNILPNKEYTVTIGTPATDATDDIEVTNTASANTITVKDAASLYKYIGEHIDTDSFQPATTGLYIFKRNTNMTNSDGSNPITEDVEFSGYYYVSSGKERATSDAAIGKYFALQYVDNEALADTDKLRSDYVLPADAYTYTDTADNGGTASDGVYEFAPTAKLALYTAKQQVIEDSDLTWEYKNVNLVAGVEIEDDGVVYKYNGTKWQKDGTDVDTTTSAKLTAAATQLKQLTATYKGAKDQSDGKTYDDIKVLVNLTNINADNANPVAEKWSAIAPTDASAQRYTFYYDNDVEEGASTTKLIDSVELSQDTKRGAYLAFDFDLNVNMDSIQVTINDDGKEAYETVTNGAWATTDTKAVAANGAAGTYDTTDSNEIATIAWTAAT